MLQETHSSIESENIWQSEWGGKAVFSHGTTSARGVAIFTSKQIYSSVKNIYKDNDGRLIILDLELNESVITLVALYAPNQDSPGFLRNISEKLKDRSEHKIIIGDFNLVLDVEKDRQNTYFNNNRAKEELESLMEEYSLDDIWRTRNPEKKEFSWWKKGSYPMKTSRIDFALVAKGLDQYIELVQYLSSLFTDHRAVYMVVELLPFQRGTGYWKFNSSLLQEKQFLDTMNQEIDSCIVSTSNKDYVERWEIIKRRIKNCAVKYSKNKTSEDKLIISQLSEKVNEYESNLPLNKSEDKLLEETKAELEEKTLDRIKGVMFRSKAKWYEEGEKNTKYFYALEKARYNAKTCYKIINDDQEEILDPYKILEEQRNFYSKLYEKDENVNFTMVNTHGLKVPLEIEKKQSIQITEEDLAYSIKTMKNKKTPGKDGIPVDFYKVFWTKLKPIFYNMMIENYTKGILHQTAREGILNLIPKANKDTRFIKNLRPITLLNTDYKIIEKAVANKMSTALEHIIHKDQRGFMKDRRISVNIRKMLDIIHTAEKEDLEAVVLSLDFVKCFDKCSFSILHGSLEYFGFGTIVKNWTKILYKEFSVKIQNNGHFSQKIEINKGVHQGGCCSSIYFLVIAEILAISLRQNQHIEGITIAEIRNLLNQFADDMDIFSMNSQNSLKQIFEELERFKYQSGFTLSYEKTTMYRIGSLRHSNAQLYDMNQVTWSKEDINVLGVTIAHEDLVDKNYSDIIQKTRSICNSWCHRGLSLIGKVEVINTLVASLFVYKMMVLPTIPDKVVKNIENTIRDFIWGGKKAKIALKILQNPKDQGGINLVDLKKKDTALKATWPTILKQEKDYAILAYKSMKCQGLKDNIWRCNLHPQDVAKLQIKNPFWEDVLRSWCEYNYYNNFRIENQVIWYNSRIRIQNKQFYWKDIHSKGLLYVHQLYSGMEMKSPEAVMQEFGLSQLRYNSLRSALPKEWKDFFTTTPVATMFPLPPHNYDICLLGMGRSTSNKVYQFLRDDAMLIHNKYMKWRIELGENFCEGLCDFASKHKDIYKLTNVPKYRSFQYRLLQRGLVTNVHMYKWGMIDTQLCSFCNTETESMLHLFVTCTQVQNLWQHLQEFLQERFNIIYITLEPENIILNQIVKKKTSVANFICLITKQFIYRQRCMKGELHFPILKSIIRSVENTEKYIAIKQEKLNLHEKKWAKINHVASIRDTNTNQMSVTDYIRNYVAEL